MNTIRDMLFVKRLEQRLGRELNEQELSGEEFEAVFPDGHVEFIFVPLIAFPDELLPDYALSFLSKDQPNEEIEYKIAV